MTTDVPLAAFLACTERSRLLDRTHLRRVLHRVRPASARDLADALVKAGDLTHYQAKNLLAGRWSGLAVGPYQILAPLGRGGVGTVFLARDTLAIPDGWDSNLVALKVLPPKAAREEPRRLVRFRREIEMGRRVSHPNVARTLRGGEADGVHFLVMEFVPGKTVKQLVGRHGPMAVGDTARVFADVAAGLAHLHAGGLVHRDLKPANVMVTPAGRAKVLDLGFALAVGEPLPDDPAVIGGKGYAVGTMDYIAPEQARDAIGVGPRADLYSLGCSLYFTLTGTPPFPGGTSREKIRRQQAAEAPPLASLNPTVPVEFARVVEWLMLKPPEARPASAAAVREVLLRFATAAPAASVWDAVKAADSPDDHPELWDEEPEAESEPGTEARSRYPLWVVVAVVLFGLWLLVALVSLARGCPE